MLRKIKFLSIASNCLTLKGSESEKYFVNHGVLTLSLRVSEIIHHCLLITARKERAISKFPCKS